MTSNSIPDNFLAAVNDSQIARRDSGKKFSKSCYHISWLNIWPLYCISNLSLYQLPSFFVEFKLISVLLALIFSKFQTYLWSHINFPSTFFSADHTFCLLLVLDSDNHVVEQPGAGGSEGMEVSCLSLHAVRDADTHMLRLEQCWGGTYQTNSTILVVKPTVGPVLRPYNTWPFVLHMYYMCSNICNLAKNKLYVLHMF